MILYIICIIIILILLKWIQKENIFKLDTKLKKLKFQSLIYVALFIIFSTISDFIIEQSILPLENYIINIICGLIVGSIFYLTSKHHIKKD